MNDEQMPETEKLPTLTAPVDISTSMATAGGLIPQNLQELWQLSTIMAKSGMMPDGLQNTQAVCVAVQMGLEVGLSPMQAVQNIAVIKGRPSLWGDAVLGLVRASGQLEDFDEHFEGSGDSMKAVCKAKRRSQDAEIVREFSVDDAKTAGLWNGKPDSAWRKYPKRMLQMRARSWTLRDGFGDIIKGLHVAEEVIDMVEKPSPKAKAEDLTESIKAGAEKKVTYEAEDITPKTESEDTGETLFDKIKKAKPGRSQKSLDEFVKLIEDNIEEINALDSDDRVYVAEKYNKATGNDLDFIGKTSDEVLAIRRERGELPQAEKNDKEAQERLDFLKKVKEGKEILADNGKMALYKEALDKFHVGSVNGIPKAQEEDFIKALHSAIDQANVA